MTTVLIANIGSRDVQIAPEHLPEHLRDWKAASERERGAYLLAHYVALRPHLQLAIIRKALTYILEHDGVLDQVVLIASDQLDPIYREKDTLVTAEVARHMIADGWTIAETQIAIWPLHDLPSENNPADVDAVLRALETPLRQLDAAHASASVYLEVSGGTTAMSEGLLLAGTSVFQDRAIALYIAPTSEMPHRLAVGKRLLGGPLREVLLAHIAGFQYIAASKAFAVYQPYFKSFERGDVVQAVLDHAAYRMNLDIPAARAAIRGLDERADGRYRRQIEHLYNATHQTSRERLLAEVLYVADIRFKTEAYADFMTQVVRFLENALRVLCLRHGAQFINWNNQLDDNGARIDSAWARNQGIDPKSIGVGQNGLQKLLQQLAPDNPATITLLEGAAQLRNIIHLRNESTHSFTGVSTGALSNAFGAEYTAIPLLLDALYQSVAGEMLANSPYSGINSFLHSLLEENH